MKQRVPPESLDVILSSLSASTKKQYLPALSKWYNFCNEDAENFYKPSVSNVLSFLTLHFNAGASYANLNTFRSAVSLISKNNIREKKLISRWFKGVFKLKPCRPKYSNTWDVSIVFNYFKNLGELNELSLTELTLKTVMLLALCSAHRAQTLASIDISDIVEKDNEIEIYITKLIKTSGPGRYQPLLVIPKFTDEPKLCAFSTLKRYLDVTKTKRNHIGNFFISLKPPVKPVCSQTISRWIKLVLCKSGVDTSIFSAHSARHAATSAAANRGVDIDTIRRTAGWTENSRVFQQFYKRHIVTDPKSFAKSIVKN